MTTDLDALALAWRAGDADAAAALLEQFGPLYGRWVRWRWNFPRPADLAIEDLLQEERLGLLEVARAWDPERGVPFLKYLAVVYPYAARNRQRRVVRRSRIERDYDHFEVTARLAARPDGAVESEDLVELAETWAGFTTQQRDACALKFGGATSDEAGSAMGISGREVNRLVERARRSAA